MSASGVAPSEHWTDEAKLYLCAIGDMFSGRVVGHSISDRMKARLAVNGLNNVVFRRRDAADCVVHSDRGSRFRSRKLAQTLNRRHLIESMGIAGAAGDNAAMESFIALLQKNVLDRYEGPGTRWTSRFEQRSGSRRGARQRRPRGRHGFRDDADQAGTKRSCGHRRRHGDRRRRREGDRGGVQRLHLRSRRRWHQRLGRRRRWQLHQHRGRREHDRARQEQDCCRRPAQRRLDHHHLLTARARRDATRVATDIGRPPDPRRPHGRPHCDERRRSLLPASMIGSDQHDQ